MARQRKEPKKAKDIKLQQPDRSGPSEETLLNFAQDRGLFDAADKRNRDNGSAAAAPAGKLTKIPKPASAERDEDPVLSPRAERVLEALLWTATMAMLHFTFDVLVQHQYGTDIKWPEVWVRAARAWAVFLILFWPLHPHDSNPVLLPFLPLKYQKTLRQVIFSVMSTVSGSYLIYITNEYGYLAIMKQAPPLGCLWLWAVVELELLWAVLSLAVAGAFMWSHGYTVK